MRSVQSASLVTLGPRIASNSPLLQQRPDHEQSASTSRSAISLLHAGLAGSVHSSDAVSVSVVVELVSVVVSTVEVWSVVSVVVVTIVVVDESALSDDVFVSVESTAVVVVSVVVSGVVFVESSVPPSSTQPELKGRQAQRSASPRRRG